MWDARPWLALTKADVAGIAIMEKKANILPVYVEKLYCGAANILKQELLSLGGELSVHKYTINCKMEYGDVLIFATYKEYRGLYRKLAMQHWKLKELGQELKIVIDNVLSIPKLEVQKLDEDGYAKLLDYVRVINPSGDLVKDMADFPLGSSSAEKNVVEFDLANFTDLKLLEQYLLAIQSKGYEVLVKCTNQEEKWVKAFFRPNYIWSGRVGG